MTETNDSRQHLIFAVLLGIAGLLIILIFVTIKSQGDTSDTSATVTNAAPSVDSIYITTSSQATYQDSITLTENTTTDVFVKGTFSDNNGCDEVSGVGGGITTTLYRSGISGGTNCSANNSNCYQTISCSFFNCTSGGSDTTGSFLCTSSVQYYTNPTDSGTYSSQTWLATATATDKYASAFATTTGGVEMNSLLAIGLGENGSGASIAYGSLALGATSAADVNLIIRNTGNVRTNPQVSGTDLTCTVGTIPNSNQKYATTTGVAYGSKTALSGAAANLNVCMSVATESASSTSSTLWMIQIPSNGVAGACTGTNTVSANTSNCAS